MTLAVTFVPDVVSLLEHINTSLVSGMQLFTWQMRFLDTHLVKTTGTSLLCWKGQQYTFIVLLQGCINSPALCPDLVCSELDIFPFHNISYWSLTLMTIC